MGALSGWTPALVVVAMLFVPLIFVRWIPQVAGRIAGAKAKRSMLLIGFGIICFVVFLIYSAHRDVCSSDSMDAKYECGISQMLLTVVLLWLVLVALSQIRFVIAAFAAVTSRQKR
jgi:hypothetical protein